MVPPLWHRSGCRAAGTDAPLLILSILHFFCTFTFFLLAFLCLTTPYLATRT